MNPLILHTGHEIANTVASALCAWLKVPSVLASTVTDQQIKDASFVIGYGILRGNDKVFKRAQEFKKPWFVVDKGYFNARHYDGNYRIGEGCTQAPWDERKARDLRSDDVILQWHGPKGKTMLICPPTVPVRDFYGINKQKWLDEALSYADEHGYEALIRDKDCVRPLNDDLTKCGLVYTFNSSVGWQAIAAGIPCISNMRHSIVGRWQASRRGGRMLDLVPSQARSLIKYLFDHQWTLAEIASGNAKEFICRSASI